MIYLESPKDLFFCEVIAMTVFSQRTQAQVFMPLIMWKGRLATAVCLCRYGKGRLERKGRKKWRGGGGELAERAKRGLKDAGAVVISEQTSPRTERLDLYDGIGLNTPEGASSPPGPADQLLRSTAGCLGTSRIFTSGPWRPTTSSRLPRLVS